MSDAAWKRLFQRRLLAWYQEHHRDLPWRRSADPYLIWISEIMLQQTQVATVIPYFERFVASFPSIKVLAAAAEHDVLRHWEGLGYYRRARQLHRAAHQLVGEHGGHFPRDLEAVKALPGIGRYTAGAIVSIAFDQRAPILEANTVRLLSRLIAYPLDVSSTAAQRVLWEFAAAILPAKGAGTHNQALMELGALVCTPRAPRCGECPVRLGCRAFQTSQQDVIPRLPAKVKVEAVHQAAVVVARAGKVLLRQCGAGERWAGLWDFPRFVIERSQSKPIDQQLVAKLRELTGVTAAPGERLTTIKHGVTRFRITLDCYAAAYVSAARSPAGAKLKWLKPAELSEYPLSTTGRKLGLLVQKATAKD